jgi:hypothetical protein
MPAKISGGESDAGKALPVWNELATLGAAVIIPPNI